MINWHRLFGIFLTDYFTDTPYTVELEKDLSLKQQFLDVVILHKGKGEYQGILADGLDNLSAHNLLSYKSMQESFDSWAVYELIGHYVNYRKQFSKPLLPESDFSLYAISTLFPQKLTKEFPITELKPGVYQFNAFKNIRLIVLKHIAQVEHNAVWHLFSDNLDKIKFGIDRYHSKMSMSGIVNELYKNYQLKELLMAYTIDDFNKEVAEKYLHLLSIDEILERISADKILDKIPTDKILDKMPTDKILDKIPTDKMLDKLSIDDLFKKFSKEDILTYLKNAEEKH